MSRSMEGKVVVVSGASMGVGRATAQRFAQEGATVVLLARRKLLLDEIADTLGANAVPIATDVTCATDLRRFRAGGGAIRTCRRPGQLGRRQPDPAHRRGQRRGHRRHQIGRAHV